MKKCVYYFALFALPLQRKLPNNIITPTTIPATSTGIPAAPDDSEHKPNIIATTPAPNVRPAIYIAFSRGVFPMF